jgi:hypothetical protein
MQIIEIHHRHVHASKKTSHGMVRGTAENSVPPARCQPGWRRCSQFVLLKKNRPAVMRAQVTRDPGQDTSAVNDRSFDDQGNLRGLFHQGLRYREILSTFSNKGLSLTVVSCSRKTSYFVAIKVGHRGGRISNQFDALSLAHGKKSQNGSRKYSLKVVAKQRQ